MTHSRLLPAVFFALCGLSAQAQVKIDFDFKKRGQKVTEDHYGIFYEEINHAGDGGLYAELVRNRSFEEDMSSLLAWGTLGNTSMSLSSSNMLNTVQKRALRVDIKSANGGVRNDGYWGMNIVNGRTYTLSFWIRAEGTYNGSITAELQSSTGRGMGSTTINVNATDEWQKLTATIRATGNDGQGRLALKGSAVGVIYLDVVSLFPPTFKNRPNGCREDLAQMLADLHPRFMRFPGGCYIEGSYADGATNRFEWKKSVGPIEERPGHLNRNWGYKVTDGLGYHECLQLAEDLGAHALFVVNMGIGHEWKVYENNIDPFIQEALDAIEYANGPITTKYGAMRAKNGHPEPFGLEYLEVGNENNQPDPRQQSDHYYERYDQFYKAIRAKYPDMKIVGNVVAWGDDNPKWNSTLPVDLLDEHYYRSPDWFAAAFHKYDSYDREGPKVYVGEYAVTNGFGNLGNMNAALGEAVYMMGMENNSDVVQLASYAPIFVNENDARWRPDMIRFSSSRVMGTPSYYVQQLMPQHIGTQVVKVAQNDPYKDKVRKQLTPRQSRVGFGTWGTRASFETAKEVEYVNGDWKKDGNTVSQTSRKEATICLEKDLVDSDHYTCKFRARKDGGAEGFLIIFNYVDDKNYCWLNFGGWGNTQHAIEQISNGGKLQTVEKRGRVESGRWYDVTLQVAGDSVKAWLDNELVFDTVLKHDVTKGIFSSATIDEASSELIVKVVNTGDVATTARVNLKNFSPQCARVVRLAANDGMDENTLTAPTTIHPVEQLLSPEEGGVLLDVPPYSLNIVRVKGSKTK